MSFSNAGSFGATKSSTKIRTEESSFEQTIKANIAKMQSQGREAEETLQIVSRSVLSKLTDMTLDDALGTCHRLETETDQTFRDWTVHMAGEPSERHRKKVIFEKLRKTFDDEVFQFTEWRRRAVAVKKEAAKNPQFDDKSDTMDDIDLEDSSSPRMMGDQATISSSLSQAREEGIKRIHGQMASVNQAFKDLAVIVSEQGTQFQTIEDEAESASTNTGQAVDELKKTLNRQGSMNVLWILVIAILCFFVMFFSISLNSGPDVAAQQVMRPVADDARITFMGASDPKVERRRGALSIGHISLV